MDSRYSCPNVAELLLVEDGIIDKVTAIQGYTDLLMERHAKDPHSLKYLSNIRKAIDGLTESIEQIRLLRQKYERK